MAFGRDWKGRIGGERGRCPWRDAAALELLPLEALKREAATTGLGAHQADRRERPGLLLTYASMVREIARRTGEPETLAKAASAAALAAREADLDELPPVRLEQARAALLASELFSDSAATDAAEGWLLGPEMTPAASASPDVMALKARIEAGRALAAGDLDRAVAAAAAFDAAIKALDAGVQASGAGRAEAAAARCDRADFMIGFGVRLKDKTLIVQAEADLVRLSARLDPAYLPLSWSRTEHLRGLALAALGDLGGDAGRLADSVTALAAAADGVDTAHSPLDQARLAHALGLSLQALAEACEDERLLGHALAAFNRAMTTLEVREALPLRAVVAHDRASCMALRAEQKGDLQALAKAEAAFRIELVRRSGGADPLAWAVAQLALARIYDARAALIGEASRPPEAHLALSEALEVFAEHGLRTLADTAAQGLERLRRGCEPSSR